MEEKEFIIIFCYETGMTYITEYDSNVIESYEEIYETLNGKFNLNLSENNSNCLITKGELNVKIL